MNHLKLFENYQSESEIEEICKEYDIENWTLNSDGLVDVDGDVNLGGCGLKIPLKFGKITGSFCCDPSAAAFPAKSWITSNQLTSLEGSPHTVGDSFNCNGNELTSLEFAPKSVGGDFHCRWNNIRSFEVLVNIGGDFYCNRNPVYEIWNIIAPWTNGWDNEKMDFFNDLDIIRGEEIAIERLNFFLEEMGSPTTVESVKGYKNIY